jgi:Na+/melibiose symporter-like transporter
LGGVILAVYCTDIGINPAKLIPVFLFLKIWDGLNDTLFGVLIDKLQLRGGKYLPWLKLAVVLVPISSIIMFTIPHNFPEWAKILWMIIAYVLWDASYTICDIPSGAMATVITSNAEEKTRILTNCAIVGSLSYAVGAILIPLMNTILRDSLGMTFNYEITVIFFTVICTLSMIPMVLFCKERGSAKTEKTISLKEMFSAMGQNKYVWLFFLSYLLLGTFNVTSTFAIHIGRYLTPLMDMFASIIGAATIVPFLIIAAFMPKLIKKFDKFNLYFYAIVASGILAISSYCIGYKNQVLFWIFTILRMLTTIFTGFLVGMFTVDCAEYGLFKSGKNVAGCTFAVQSFTIKVMASLASVISLSAMVLIGFKEGAPVNGVPVAQPEGIRDGLWWVYLLIPATGQLLALVPLFFYKLRDYKVQIMAASNKGVITREEADTLLKLDRKTFITDHEPGLLLLLEEAKKKEQA